MQFSNNKRRQDRLHWLAEIYRAYAADLQHFIASKIGDPTEAEDLTSTVFLKALRWLREDESAENVHGWLYATARTTIVDYWQTQRKSEMHSLSGLEEHLLGNDDTASANRQVEMRVQHLLSLLPQRDRTILTLRYLQGYSAPEIAVALGTSAGHIRVLQLRALRRAAQVETMERNRYWSMQAQGSPFDSFAKIMTPESHRVLALAREEMLNLKHWWIGTEHLLWGLASEESLKSFLTPLSITPERIHAGIVFIFDREKQGPAVQGSPPLADVSSDALKLLTPRAKQVIFLAAEEMKSQGEQSIRPPHLLLGLLNEGEGLGAGLLRSLGVSLSQARTMLAPPATNLLCSFCGRSGSQVARFFPAEVGIAESSAPSSGTFICDHCVRRFHTLLETPL